MRKAYISQRIEKQKNNKHYTNKRQNLWYSGVIELGHNNVNFVLPFFVILIWLVYCWYAVNFPFVLVFIFFVLFVSVRRPFLFVLVVLSRLCKLFWLLIYFVMLCYVMLRYDMNTCWYWDSIRTLYFLCVTFIVGSSKFEKWQRKKIALIFGNRLCLSIVVWLLIFDYTCFVFYLHLTAWIETSLLSLTLV